MCRHCLSRYAFFFFFFKQKTAYEMRISDWSSDVCSSDLLRPPRPVARKRAHRAARHEDRRAVWTEGAAGERAGEGVMGELPRNHFGAILADPPWRFRTWTETNQKKSASRHYDQIGRAHV